MERVTEYFKNEILRKRPYLTVKMCRSVISNHVRREIQPGGRIRHWGLVDESGGGKHLRVVTLEDGKILHNAFIDRGFKP